MNKILYIIAAVAMLTACSGSGGQQEHEEDYTNDASQEFVPEGGMSLQGLCDMPGLTWDVDTIYGVCVPDTLVLWACYGNRHLPTNVRGAEYDFIGLTELGIKNIKNDTMPQPFRSAHFTDEARLLYNLDYTPARMRHDADSLLERRVMEMIGVATDFFTSHGMVKYMAKPLAGVWEKVNADAQIQGIEPANPINGYNRIEFQPGSIAVVVDDAQKGSVRVRAYCLDPFTIGHEGWAFWRMTMCREGRYFKVKNPPILIRSGSGDFYDVERETEEDDEGYE